MNELREDVIPDWQRKAILDAGIAFADVHSTEIIMPRMGSTEPAILYVRLHHHGEPIKVEFTVDAS